MTMPASVQRRNQWHILTVEENAYNQECFDGLKYVEAGIITEQQKGTEPFNLPWDEEKPGKAVRC